MDQSTSSQTIDEYIGRFPAEVQAILQKIRTTIREAVPEAEETISYQMPTFKLRGKYLAYFAAFKHHIGFYPTPSGIEALKEEVAPYEAGKGTLRFPLDKPIPYELITKIIAVREKEVLSQAAAKKKKK